MRTHICAYKLKRGGLETMQYTISNPTRFLCQWRNVLWQDDTRKASAQYPSGQFHHPPRCTVSPTLFSPSKSVLLLTPHIHTLAGLCPSTQLAFRAHRACAVLFALTDAARSHPTDPPNSRTGLGHRADGDRLAASTHRPAHRQAHRAHPR